MSQTSSCVTGDLTRKTSWRQVLWTEQIDSARLDIALVAPGS